MIDPNAIFKIKTEQEFRDATLNVFRFQAEHNLVYKSYIQHLNIDINTIYKIEEIPFLPIQFFKTKEIKTENLKLKNNKQPKTNNQKPTTNNQQLTTIFTSSGTTGNTKSRHYVQDLTLYHKSLTVSFQQFYGDFRDYCILALLPSYLERKGSSLIEMVNYWMQKTSHLNNGFFLYNHKDLKEKLLENEQNGQSTILIGVSFALLDFAEVFPLELPNTTIIETGGMKGRKEEIIRAELHQILQKKLNPKRIDSEYGMTELLSQCYAQGGQQFQCPNWMRVLVRETEDPFSMTKKTGGVNVIDLANLYSCSFIATDDLGVLYSDNSFEILGRFDHSDVRGCSLLLKEG